MSDIICSKEQPIGDKSLLKADSTTTAKTKDLPSFLKMPTPEAVEVFQAAFDNHTDSVPFDGRLVPNQWVLNERSITATVAADFDAQIESLQREIADRDKVLSFAGVSYRRDKDGIRWWKEPASKNPASLIQEAVAKDNYDATIDILEQTRTERDALQRENETQRRLRDEQSEYTIALQRLIEHYCGGKIDKFDREQAPHHYDMLSKAATITPEMREKIERALEIGPGNDPKFSERVFRDLLGEQDA